MGLILTAVGSVSLLYETTVYVPGLSRILRLNIIYINHVFYLVIALNHSRGLIKPVFQQNTFRVSIIYHELIHIH